MLIAPSVSLMMRLNFTKKAVILTFIVFLAITAVTIPLFNYLYEDIEIAQQELKGLALYPDLFKLVQLLQKHRGASAGVLGGAHDLSTQRKILQQEVTNTAEIVKAKLPTDILNSEAWNEIASDWNTIIEDGMTWSVETNFDKHTLLIQVTQKLINNLSDKYNLTNPPHLAMYYLINTALYQLSPAQEYFGQVRAFGTGILAKKFASKAQQIKVSALISQAQNAIKILDNNLDKAGSYNPNIKLILSDTTKKINDKTQRVLSLFESSIYSEKYTLSPKNFFNLMSKIIDGSYVVLYEIIIPTTKRLIVNHLAQAEHLL